MSKPLIGIEINDNEVCMVQLGSKKLLVSERLPEKLVENNKIVSADLLADYLKKMKKHGGFSGSACAVVLPEYSTYFRTMRYPPISQSQLLMNLPYEFRDFVGSESPHYNYDYAVVDTTRDAGGNISMLDLIAGAAQKVVVSEYNHMLRKAGLSLKIALPHEAAIINLMRKSPIEENQEICLIGIGFRRTQIYIFEGIHLRATKSIDIGCAQIDEAIAAKFNIDAYLATTYREANSENILADPLCQEVYDRLALEIMKAVNFYKYENQQTNLDTVCYFSAGANNPYLTDTIKSYIQFDHFPISALMPEGCDRSEFFMRCVLAAGASM